MEIDKAIRFLKNAKPPVAIFGHWDTDGCTSAAQIYCALGRNADIYMGEIAEENFERFFKKNAPNYSTAVVVDLPMDQYETWLENLYGKTELALIDHHPPEKDMNRAGCVHVNPRLKDPKARISASQVCYVICKLGDYETRHWLAKIGAIGDHITKGNPREERAALIVDSVSIIDGEDACCGLVRALAGYSSFEDFLADDAWTGYPEIVGSEVKKHMERINAQITVEKSEINFIRLDSRYKVGKLVVNSLLTEHPEKTFFVHWPEDDRTVIEARSYAYNVGKICKEASTGIGMGGGHPMAAGARVRDFGKFRESAENAIKSGRYRQELIFPRRVTEIIGTKNKTPA